MRTNPHGQPIGPEVPGWTPRPRARAVSLVGRHVDLEPLALQDAPALHAALGDPADDPLWTYRPRARPTDLGAFEELVEAHLAAVPELETMVVVPHGRTACGLVSLTRIEAAHGQVEVAGVLYGRSLQRTTAATEAIHLLMRHVFDDLGYRRFEWKCDSLNEPSRRAALRLGFTYEGTFRQHLVVRGRRRDTDWFSVLDGEWPRIRGAQERWLDPANHDGQGHQRERLVVPDARTQ